MARMADPLRFDRFVLDRAERRLTRDGAPVELNARYFDALALLVGEAGRLVTKDRLLAEVWRGVPVTDEALTQCVKALRQRLGDDAARPRFIETVPKHGYRFVAPLADAPVVAAATPRDWHRALVLGSAGTLGGALAGVVGGFGYGLLATSLMPPAAMGAASVLVVLLAVTAMLGALGGAGVAFGAALAGGVAPRWTAAGAAAGGSLVGLAFGLLGSDAFVLLLGRAPGDITGAPEGLVLGGAVGLALQLGGRLRAPGLGRRVALAAAAGALAGLLIVLAGGHLLAGSLAELGRAMPDARLRLDLGPVAGLLAGAAEGALFAAGVAGGMLVAGRALSPPAPPGGTATPR